MRAMKNNHDEKDEMTLCKINHGGMDVGEYEDFRSRKGAQCDECGEHGCAVKMLDRILVRNPRLYVTFIDLLTTLDRQYAYEKELNDRAVCSVVRTVVGDDDSKEVRIVYMKKMKNNHADQ